MDLTIDQLQAALDVARDRLSNEKIATKYSICERTLDAWKKLPEFQSEVTRHLNAWRDKVLTDGVADKRRRLSRLNDRWRRLQAVIEQRAKDPDMNGIPGHKTGLLVRRLRSITVGFQEYETVNDVEVDTGLLAELRAIEQHAAIEVGDWKTKVEATVEVNDKSDPKVVAMAFGPEELESMLARIKAAKESAGRRASTRDTQRNTKLIKKAENTMSMVTGKSKEKSGKRQVTSMHIERAKNGFSASRHFEKPKASAQAKMSMPDYEPPESNVFGDHKALAQHVQESFGDDEGGAAGGAMPNAGAPDESE